MSETPSPDFDKAIREMDKLLNKFPKIAGNHAVNYSLDAFKNESWDGTPWKKRKQKDPRGRKILVGKGGNARLKKSVRVVETSKGFVRISSDTPYSKIHNEGGEINHPGGTPYIIIHESLGKRGGKDKRFKKWKSGDRETATGIKAMFVSKAKANELAAEGVEVKYTRPHVIPIPQRQFMGNSEILNRILMEELRIEFGETIEKAILQTK